MTSLAALFEFLPAATWAGFVAPDLGGGDHGLALDQGLLDVRYVFGFVGGEFHEELNAAVLAEGE